MSLQRTHDNYVKLSLVLDGGTPGQQYYVRAANGAAFWPDDNVYANSRGVVRVKLTSTDPIEYTSTFGIRVDEAPYDGVWEFGTYAISVPSN